MPKSEEEFRSKILEMEEAWQFPCCWSAVDGCHIPIKCPPGGLESCKAYHNFKNFFSVVLMVWLIPSIVLFGLAAAILAIRMTQSFFSPLIYGMKSRTRNISPKLQLFCIHYAFLKFCAQLSYSERDTTPLALSPALQFVEHFFVNFSVLLIFGIAFFGGNSNNYINQIVNLHDL